MSIRGSGYQFTYHSEESDNNSSDSDVRRRRRAVVASERNVNPAQQAAESDADDEPRDFEMKVIPVEEQEQMARRDAAMSSFEIRTLSVDSSFLFPADVNEEIMGEMYERAINPPLDGEIDDPDYCYLCRAANDRGTNQHVTKMNRLAEAVTTKSFETVIDDISSYYNNTLRRTENRRLRGATIRKHYIFHAPSMLWHAKQDLNRTTDIAELLMRSMVHADHDGTNQRVVQEHYKLYRAVDTQKRAHLQNYIRQMTKK